MKRVLFTLLMIPLLTGCSWLFGDKSYFRDRGDDYRKSRAIPVLTVPSDMNADSLQELYIIPAITEEIRVTGEFEVPRPAPLVAGSSEEVVRLQKLGEEQWMLVSFAPGQLWPQVRAYLSEAGFPLARIEARDGLIETAWISAEEGAMAQRYRFRIEQGVQRNTAELHVLQMFQAGDIDAWPEESADLVEEDRQLRELAQYVANNVDQTPVSMMAQQSISASGRVSMQEDSAGNPVIRLELPFYRAWASLDRAIRDSSFEITDRNLTEKVYFMRYSPDSDEEDGGWFGWLFGGDDNSRTEALEKYGYRLQLVEDGENSVLITVHREDDGPLDQEQAQGILALIKGNIS